MFKRNYNPDKFTLGIFLFSALLIAIGALFLFGRLAEEMMEGDTQQFDSVVRNAVHQHATPQLTSAMQVFSFLGSVTWMVGFGLLVVCACFYFRRPRIAGFLAITMAGVGALDYVLKLAFHRPRPIAFYGASPASYSFPSGHALGSFCFYGVLAAVLASRAGGRKLRSLIWLTASLLVGLIGLSRIYLGVHYPSDVIAGYLAGAVWVIAVTIADKILLDRREKKINIAKILK
jgi:membrane-associated phospholipid phosphatase